MRSTSEVLLYVISEKAVSAYEKNGKQGNGNKYLQNGR